MEKKGEGAEDSSSIGGEDRSGRMPGEQWGMKTCQAAEVHGGAGRRALSCTQATKHNNVHTYTYIDIYAIKTLLHATAGSATDTGGKGGGTFDSCQTRPDHISSDRR